ncbi:efflux RND transporter periplasmic adaptor subunit, partial [Mesorhizobium escarrei]|uniref:efflux RND transporter periplasmic adaptor subunit n=1 Tax=Mesorhizobium escarrei TaxID=666018 RepID=UPI0020A6F548
SEVGFEVGGRIISRDVDIGAVVKKGQKLAELSAVDYRNKVTAAQADLTATKATLVQVVAQEERFRILLGKGFTTRSQYDEALKSLQSAQAAVQAAEANLRIVENQLGYTQLLAPDDGIVTAAGADPGQVVAAGQMIVEISRNDA